MPHVGIGQLGSGPRNRDLLYFAPLTFKPDGSIEQLEYSKSVTI
jgi:hypothetical protein